MKTIALLIAASMIAMPQGNVNTGNLPPARYDDGLGNEKTPNFTGDVTMEAQDGGFDVAPRWIRRPTNAQVGAVFPARAVERGIDGSADLRCTLTVDGALTDCAVERESPAGIGFGGAARALAPDLNVAPATRAGRPVETSVLFKMTFTGPGDRTVASRTGVSTAGAQPVLVAVPWTNAPSYQQVVAAYPAAARAANKGGRATLDCTFSPDGSFLACDVSNEEPAGLGFGQAARSLAPYFRAPATLSDGSAIGGKAIKVPVTFTERMLQADARPTTGRPALARMPSNEDFGRAFPAEARRAAVLQSEVMMECVIGEGGELNACRVASETPEGYGFGQAALALAPKFQVNPWSAEGLPMEGGRIRVPVKYQLKTAS